MFAGYGWKLKKIRDALVAQVVGKYDYILFTDSFDSYVFCSPAEIIKKFKWFGHPMVVSGEVNMWPNPDLKQYMPESSKTGHYKFPNSGGYMAEVPYFVSLLDDIAIHWKSDCVDDQGELIKALARNNSVFVIDHKAVLFQTLYG